MIVCLISNISCVVRTFLEKELNGEWIKDKILECLATIDECGFTGMWRYSNNVSAFKKLHSLFNATSKELCVKINGKKINFFLIRCIYWTTSEIICSTENISYFKHFPSLVSKTLSLLKEEKLVGDCYMMFMKKMNNYNHIWCSSQKVKSGRSPPRQLQTKRASSINNLSSNRNRSNKEVFSRKTRCSRFFAAN